MCILLEPNSASRHYLDKNFSLKHISLSPQIEIAVHDLLIQFASIHLGVSCVVEEFSKDAIDKGTIKKMEITPPLPPRSIGYAFLKHNPLSLPVQAFLNMIKGDVKKVQNAKRR